MYPPDRLMHGADQRIHERRSGLELGTSKLIVPKTGHVHSCKVVCKAHKDTHDFLAGPRLLGSLGLWHVLVRMDF